MNRGYSYKEYKNKIDMLITSMPDIAITTDIITGFPGETEEYFLCTIKALAEIEYDGIFAFKYSKRPDTVASLFNNQINAKIKQDRVKILIDIANKKNTIYLNRNLGKTLDVIVESNAATNGLYNCISDNYLKLSIKSDNLSKAQRLKVIVISLTGSGLFAEPLKK